MPPKKKAANGYKMPDPLPKGEIITDIHKKQWKLGKSIGKGGFGEIYETMDASEGGSNYPYVMKIEPHQNGPLFVEMNFYLRVNKKELIEEFMKETRLKALGIPPYISSGSHEYKGEKYRFLVMEKYGKDIWKFYLENNKKFPDQTAYKIGIQVLNALEYIHSKDYIHADIKGANILQGLGKGKENNVYLVDFGLATKFTTATEFKPDPKRAHDGTIEYLSRDAHKGVPTRRGDLEILFYNLIHWMGCKLPWENCLGDPKAVEQSKIHHMDKDILETCFDSRIPPKALVNYYNYLKALKFNEKPDYKKLRGIINAGLLGAGENMYSPLKFDSAQTSLKRRSGVKNGDSTKKQKVEDKPAARRGRKPSTLQEDTPKKRGRRPGPKSKQPIDSEDETESESESDSEICKDSDSDSGQSNVSETAEMIRIRKKIALKNKGKKVPTLKHKADTEEKKSVTPTRARLARNVKPPTYQIGQDSDEEIISDSEEEAPRKPTKKRV